VFKERDQPVGRLERAAPQMRRNDLFHGVELLCRIAVLKQHAATAALAKKRISPHVLDLRHASPWRRNISATSRFGQTISSSRQVAAADSMSRSLYEF